MDRIRTRRARARRRKVIAIAAAGAVALAGATVTSLAAWVDQEWVTAGVNGMRASTFEVQQRVSTDPAQDWFDRETGPGGVVSFGSLAQSLSPDASVVGYVSLRTVIGSVGARLTLMPATGNTSSTLGAALRYSAWLHDESSTCNDANYATSTVLVNNQPLNVGSGTTTFDLDAGTATDPGDDKTVCFRITLPDGASNSLQGQSATIGWYFDAASR